MSEANKKLSNQELNEEETKTDDRPAEETASDRVFDPLKLVSTTSFDRDPREILENPAVAPEMLEGHDDLRDDLRT
jgi:hypothetical protein